MSRRSDPKNRVELSQLQETLKLTRSWDPSPDWLSALLIQQFVLSLNGSAEYADVKELWELGLIERVEMLTGPELLFIEGMDWAQARSILRVKRSLEVHGRSK